METTQEPERAANSIQVSLDKLPTFYARIGRRMFGGSADKPPFDEVVITGLGMATKTAIGAASIIERENIAFIGKVETAYFSSTRSKRRIPKITITLAKNPEDPVIAEEEVKETTP
eukprot:GHVO01046716.1.p2 GENE.GHVO01046716.1~~GHVO01046716.1.p2  ORF type:complete len:129 (-),score=22.46 GHVO01046716.1:117-464(-)